MQRLLVIVAAVIVIAGVGVGVYFMFFAGGANIIVAPSGDADTLPEAGSVPTAPVDEETPVVDIEQPRQVAARLVQISKGPVVTGAVVYTASSTDSAPEVAVNFIARESGNIYRYLVQSGSLTRTSNKTIPGIQETLWLPDGSLAYVRYLSGETHDTINTYALPESGDGGYFLAQNIADLSVHDAEILTVAEGTNGSVATRSRADGSNARQVFVTPLSMLRANFLGVREHLTFTKPSALTPGYAYLVNSIGNFERIAGPLNGLVALPSSSGEWVLISYSSQGLPALSLYEVKERTLIALPIATIADKCVWADDDRAVYCGVPIDPPESYIYPDDWYQGAVAFRDRLWKIDVEGRFAELVLDFEKETGQSLDATGLAIDTAPTILVFKNKRDASLWSYAL